MTERKFDYDDALRRYQAGQSVASIARLAGVSRTAVRRVVIPGFKERLRASSIKAIQEARHRGLPCPRCGERMGRTSKMCRRCTNDLRLGPIPSVAAKPGELDYFPEGGRYGLLAVSGVSNMHRDLDSWGTTFAVVDSNDMWLEVSRTRVAGSKTKAKRKQLIALIQKMNRADAARDLAGP